VNAGVVWQPWTTTPAQPGPVSLRVASVLEWLSLTHTSPDAATSSRDRWLAGVEAGADLRARLGPRLEALAGIGAVDVFSPTYISVRGVSAATLPAVAATAELGLGFGL
jgi:hypothetical protein